MTGPPDTPEAPPGEPGPSDDLAPLDPALLPVLAALHAEVFPEEPWSEPALAGLLAGPGCFGRLAVPGGAPAGFVLARMLVDEAEILSLGVRPAARRRGLGRRLLEAALAQARDAGAGRMHLEVAEDNAAARAFYAAAGFAEVGRRHAYYHSARAGPVDALLLARRLDTWATL